jgi:hypothetical protein
MKYDWKLIGLLSLFGLAMAFGTVWVVPSQVEPLCWLAIFSVCAVIIAKKAPGRFFLHGLFTSLVNCVWITSAHIAFAATYLANHPQEAEMTKNMPMPDSPRVMMAVMGPLVGLVSGLVLGGMSALAAKLLRKS